MSPSANVQSVQTLSDLKVALGRFAGDAREALQASEQENRRTLDWLQERQNHWQGEVRRLQEEVRRVQTVLARCQASGYTDKNGNYHAPDCHIYEQELRESQRRLRDTEAELRNVQQWARQVQQAVTEYQAQARRLQELATNHTPKAQAYLERAIADLEQYLAIIAASASQAAGISVSSSSPSAPVTHPGVPWATKRAILEKLDSGHSITREELEQLGEPVSDLQAETVAEDETWVRSLMESERFREAMANSFEADNLAEALAATVIAAHYWQSKE